MEDGVPPFSVRPIVGSLRLLVIIQKKRTANSRQKSMFRRFSQYISSSAMQTSLHLFINGGHSASDAAPDTPLLRCAARSSGGERRSAAAPGRVCVCTVMGHEVAA